MAVTVWMDYIIWINDPVEYQFALDSVGGNPFLEMAPKAAADMLGIPFTFPAPTFPFIDPKGIWFVTMGPGSEIKFPDPTGIFVDENTLSYTVPGQPWFLDANPPEGIFTWSGLLSCFTAGGVASNPPPTAISQRRWSLGYEWSNTHEGANYPQNGCSVDASRTCEGCGYAIRGETVLRFIMPTNQFRVISPETSWERHYIRIRRLPSAGGDIFIQFNGNNGQSSCALVVTSTGNIEVYNVSAGGAFFLKGNLVTGLTLNEWIRLDVFIRMSNPVVARMQFFVNGVNTFNFSDGTGEGINQSTVHSGTSIGVVVGFTNADFEMDIDDSMNADLPSNVDPVSLSFLNDDFGVDWIIGSHIRKHYCIPASGGSVTDLTNWAPNSYGNLNQGINTALGIDGEIASSTALAQIQCLTDALHRDDPYALGEVRLGVASGTIGSNNRNAGGTDGQLGYSSALGPIVQSTINQTGALQTFSKAFQPTGEFIPSETHPFFAIRTKSNDANLDTNRSLVIALEYLSVNGFEDNPLFPSNDVSRLGNIHNAPYQNSSWGFMAPPPPPMLLVQSDVYVGNGTTQQIGLDGPVHFLMIRRVGGAGGVFWFSTSLGPTPKAVSTPTPNLRVFADTFETFKFEVNGISQDLNQVGVTYQYVAFGDPENRFCLNGVFGHAAASTSPVSNPLINTLFNADAGFVQRNEMDTNAPAIANGIWFKGSGIGGNAFRQLTTGTNLADGGSFAAGDFITRAGFHTSAVVNNSFNLWRVVDGSADCNYVMIQILNYVGDGVSPRNITLTPTSNRFPALVAVIPNNATIGRMRDPSHVGVNSMNLSTWDVDGGGGIEAVGMDQITVGASLNTGGVTYSVFAICGSNLGMVNGSIIPSVCEIPDGGPRIPPSAPLGDINVIGDGGLIFNGTTPLLMLQDVSGIYTLVPGKLNDTLQDRQTGQESVDVPILPIAKTGYIGG